MSSQENETYPQTFSETAQPKQTGPVSRFFFLLLLFSLVFITRPSIHGNDGVQNYSYARSLIFDSNLDFTNEYDHFISKEADWFDKKQIPRDPLTNLPINLYGVGSSILWSPWILWAHGVISVLNLNGYHLDASGYSWPYEWAISFGSAFYATLALWLLFRKFRSMTSEMSAFWAVLIIWLASPLFFYMYVHPSMSHANSFFLSTLFLLQVFTRRKSAGRWFLFGLTCGLLTVTRFQDGILLVGLLISEFWDFCRTEESKLRWIAKSIGFYLCWLIGFIVVISLQLLAWQKLQGSWTSGPRAYMMQGTLDLLHPRHLTDVLFSSRHGLLYWHPALVLGFAGLLIAGRYLKEKLLCLICFAVILWVTGSWSIWWAGASFGQRMFISSFPFLAFGALFTVGRQRWVGILLKVVLIVAIIWNFGCIVQYGLGLIPRQKEVTFAEFPHNNFVTIPNLIIEKLQSAQ